MAGSTWLARDPCPLGSQAGGRRKPSPVPRQAPPPSSPMRQKPRRFQVGSPGVSCASCLPSRQLAWCAALGPTPLQLGVATRPLVRRLAGRHPRELVGSAMTLAAKDAAVFEGGLTTGGGGDDVIDLQVLPRAADRAGAVPLEDSRPDLGGAWFVPRAIGRRPCRVTGAAGALGDPSRADGAERPGHQSHPAQPHSASETRARKPLSLASFFRGHSARA
jgi:hypothetical protein